MNLPLHFLLRRPKQKNLRNSAEQEHSLNQLINSIGFQVIVQKVSSNGLMTQMEILPKNLVRLRGSFTVRTQCFAGRSAQ